MTAPQTPVKVPDREFRRHVTTAYRRLQNAVRKASKITVEHRPGRELSIAWRLVDDLRGELLQVLEVLIEKKKGE